MSTENSPDLNQQELKVVIDNYDSDGPFEYDGDCLVLDGVLFTGLVRGYHDNGVLKHETPILDGFEHGITREWYSNQQLAEECHMLRGRVSGMHRKWHPNGQIKFEQLCRGGVRIYTKVWDDQGESL